MNCTTPCHGHTHRQGRGCECDTNATRAALYMQDGGHTFHRGVVWPMQPGDGMEHDDAPLYTTDDAGRWVCIAAIGLSLLVIAWGVASAFAL